ncbi:stalk domain-containing protein [Paenibacillus rhizophilus]|nr:stalk domain-containing protein [Paenibacillus rhizophilus]
MSAWYRMKHLSGLLLASTLVFTVLPVRAKAAQSSVYASATLSGIKEIVAAPGFWGGSAFALGKDGTVWSWGSNYFGQFANGTAGPANWSNAPHRIAGLEGTKRLVPGGNYYMALGLDGKVKVWGAFLRTGGRSEAAPSGDQWVIPLPETIDGLTGITDIAAGGSMALALRKDGKVMAWLAPDVSSDDSGPSAGSTGGTLSESVNSTGGTLSESVNSTGGTLSASVNSTGGALSETVNSTGATLSESVNSTGDTLSASVNSTGATPSVSAGTASLLPSAIPVSGLSGVKAIYMDGENGLTVKNDGTLWLITKERAAAGGQPVKIPGPEKVQTVETGDGGLMVLTRGGKVWAPLSAADAAVNRLEQVPGLSSIVSIQNGYGFNLLKNTKGEYLLWEAGTNLKSLQKVTVLSGISSLTLDFGGLAAVRKDGTLWLWHRNYQSGKLTFTKPRQMKGVVWPVSFAAGENSKYAVLADGTAMAWGTNIFGQLGIGVNESRPFTASPLLKPVSLRVGGKLLNPAQPPLYRNGKVYVPLRTVAEGLGFTVKIENDGSVALTGHGRSVAPPAAGSFKVSYTQLVPAGKLAESLGFLVNWDSKSYEISFVSMGQK